MKAISSSFMDRKFKGLEDKDEMFKNIEQMKKSFEEEMGKMKKDYVKWLDS